MVNSDLLVDSHFAVGNNLYASVFGEGKVTFQSLRSAGDVAQGTDIGSISGEILETGGMVDLSVTEQGDIRFMQISAVPGGDLRGHQPVRPHAAFRDDSGSESRPSQGRRRKDHGRVEADTVSGAEAPETGLFEKERDGPRPQCQ